jgi:chemotaxis receptor (MCP) glutamine deamidase CheD
MHKPLAKISEHAPKEIKIGPNECRIARQGERLVARGILADVVVTMQVPVAGFAAMLRFSVPEEAAVSRPRLQALWDFADDAITLLIDSIRSMGIPLSESIISAIGGADIEDVTFDRGKQLALAVERSLWRQRITLHGKDLGGTMRRGIWLESSSGRLIVRSSSSQPAALPSPQEFFVRGSLVTQNVTA